MTDQLSHLSAISPLDGRYWQSTSTLSDFVSEYALIRYRVKVEVEWLIHLAEQESIPQLAALSNDERASYRTIWQAFTPEDAQEVRHLEATTNHDVKSVEYYVKERVLRQNIGGASEFVHFACTSEDINNLAYGLMLNELREFVLVPQMNRLITKIAELAMPMVDLPMLARTHGQTASPTTMGKELAVFVDRLHGWLKDLNSMKIMGKMNGAVGNFNAHVVAVPNLDWQLASAAFVESLGLHVSPITTQIEPHDYIARYLNAICGFNQVLLDMVRDIWSYISIGYFKQKQINSETGSSTMPHKVNPIDFENAEGNIGVANSLARHLADKLTISRWQRDLSDSTAMRNIGVTVGHTVTAWTSTQRGLDKLNVDENALKTDLNESWEVLSEAVQTVMRLNGLDSPYEKVKDFTRGRKFDATLYQQLLEHLELPSTIHDDLSELTPELYTGEAGTVAVRILRKWTEPRESQ